MEHSKFREGLVTVEHRWMQESAFRVAPIECEKDTMNLDDQAKGGSEVIPDRTSSFPQLLCEPSR
jgi:hypothetical protein